MNTYLSTPILVTSVHVRTTPFVPGAVVAMYMCCDRRWRWRVRVGMAGMGSEHVGWTGDGAGAALASGVTRKLVETMTMKTYRFSPFGEKNRRPFHIESP
jgi:hypothetical protein